MKILKKYKYTILLTIISLVSFYLNTIKLGYWWGIIWLLVPFKHYKYEKERYQTNFMSECYDEEYFNNLINNENKEE